MSKSSISARELAQSMLQVCVSMNIEPMEAMCILMTYERMIPALIQFNTYSMGKNSTRYRSINGVPKEIPCRYRLVKENIETLALEGWIEADPLFDKEFNMWDLELTEKCINLLDSIFSEKQTSYGSEFWDMYPESVSGEGGRKFVLTATDKLEFIQAYEQEVDLNTHRTKVIPWLRQAKQKGEIRQKITLTLANKPWEKFKPQITRSPKLS